tara:strand:+ start:365 stop:970 length:606 start_codon:yes stop_codon:yes gene_type:complete
MIKSFKSFISEEFEFLPKGPLVNISLPNPDRDLDAAVERLKELMEKRTAEDERSIRIHDEQPFYAIEQYCKKNGLEFHDGEMRDIIEQALPTIMHFKKLFNLKRPFDHDKSIVPMSSTTNKTPAYPSGHATQAMLVALYVSDKFPEHSGGVVEAAKECGYGRVLAGFHYLQDYTAGNLLAEKMGMFMNRKDNYGLKELDDA